MKVAEADALPPTDVVGIVIPVISLAVTTTPVADAVAGVVALV